MALRILVVGGNSRAALVFRRRAFGDDEVVLTSLVRRPAPNRGPDEQCVVSDYFDPPAELLEHTDVVVNFVAAVRTDDAKVLDEINVEGPVRLGRKAAQQGVRHFIHISSFHVYGLSGEISRHAPENPMSPYGRSKQRADRGVLALQSSEFAVTTLRIPMLYGYGTGENLRKLALMMAKLRCFPVAKPPVLRSLMHAENLAAVLQSVIRRRTAGIQLCADPEPFTIDLLADMMGEVSGRAPRLVRLPAGMFQLVRPLVRGIYSRLYQPNYVHQNECVVPDGGYPVGLRQGLAEMLARDVFQAGPPP